MANIKPFKAYFFNSEKVGDLSTIVSPTKYNMTDDERNKFYDLNEYNAVRLFDGKSEPDDNEQSNKYTRSADYLYN